MGHLSQIEIHDPYYVRYRDERPVAIVFRDLVISDKIGFTYSGQEGFPATGVWRVRDVESQAAQWRFGGGPADTNHTRIIDLAWPAGATPTQEEMLSAYPPSQEADMDALGPGDFAQVRILVP